MSKEISKILSEGSKKRDGINEKPTTPKPKFTPPAQVPKKSESQTKKQ